MNKSITDYVLPPRLEKEAWKLFNEIRTKVRGGVQKEVNAFLEGKAKLSTAGAAKVLAHGVTESMVELHLRPDLTIADKLAIAHRTAYLLRHVEDIDKQEKN